jgi:hypothetical protein
VVGGEEAGGGEEQGTKYRDAWRLVASAHPLYVSAPDPCHRGYFLLAWRPDPYSGSRVPRDILTPLVPRKLFFHTPPPLPCFPRTLPVCGFPVHQRSYCVPSPFCLPLSFGPR